jgi:hypothetical protein
MINRQQDPRSKRQEEFDQQVHLARQSSEGMDKASPEVREAAVNQSKFSENRKKYLGGQ